MIVHMQTKDDNGISLWVPVFVNWVCQLSLWGAVWLGWFTYLTLKALTPLKLGLLPVRLGAALWLEVVYIPDWRHWPHWSWGCSLWGCEGLCGWEWFTYLRLEALTPLKLGLLPVRLGAALWLEVVYISKTGGTDPTEAGAAPWKAGRGCVAGSGLHTCDWRHWPHWSWDCSLWGWEQPCGWRWFIYPRLEVLTPLKLGLLPVRLGGGCVAGSGLHTCDWRHWPHWSWGCSLWGWEGLCRWGWDWWPLLNYWSLGCYWGPRVACGGYTGGAGCCSWS